MSGPQANLPEDPVMRQVVSTIAKDSVYPSSFPLENGSYAYVHGLTKRQQFAAMAPAGVVKALATQWALQRGEPDELEGEDGGDKPVVPAKVLAERYAEAAVMYADALLKELAK